MSTNEETLKYYKNRYGYDSWPKDRRLNVNMFVWQFYLSGNEFSRWEPLSRRRVELDSHPPLITSTWLYQKNKQSRASTLNVDIFECETRDAAHDQLLQMLRQFQSPAVEEYSQEEIGDVAFTDPARRVLLFARANLAVSISNGSIDCVEVDEWALRFDDYLIKRPAKIEPELQPAVGQAATPAEPIDGDPIIPLDVRCEGPAGKQVWYKFFSRSGRVRCLRGHPYPCYRAGADAAQHQLTVFTINPSDGAGKQQLTLNVSQPGASPTVV